MVSVGEVLAGAAAECGQLEVQARVVPMVVWFHAKTQSHGQQEVQARDVPMVVWSHAKICCAAIGMLPIPKAVLSEFIASTKLESHCICSLGTGMALRGITVGFGCGGGREIWYGRLKRNKGIASHRIKRTG